MTGKQIILGLRTRQNSESDLKLRSKFQVASFSLLKVRDSEALKSD
jgi:hypothetical protein